MPRTVQSAAFLLYSAVYCFQDEHIDGEKASFNITGGCCTLVALFICGKLYVANAGDCRYHTRSLHFLFWKVFL